MGPRLIGNSPFASSTTWEKLRSRVLNSPMRIFNLVLDFWTLSMKTFGWLDESTTFHIRGIRGKLKKRMSWNCTNNIIDSLLSGTSYEASIFDQRYVGNLNNKAGFDDNVFFVPYPIITTRGRPDPAFDANEGGPIMINYAIGMKLWHEAFWGPCKHKEVKNLDHNPRGFCLALKRLNFLKVSPSNTSSNSQRRRREIWD